MCEICSKLTTKAPQRRQIFFFNKVAGIQSATLFKKKYWRRSGVYIVNFEQISHIVLVFSLLALNK